MIASVVPAVPVACAVFPVSVVVALSALFVDAADVAHFAVAVFVFVALFVVVTAW